MSRNGRIGLIVAAVLVAVLAFVIASPGDDDEGGEASQTTTPTQTQATTPAEAKPQATKIQVRGGKAVGGPPEINVKNGDTVQIVVSADAPDTLHLHGYDIEKTAESGKPARFEFKADAEGEFELESHTAEDAGLDPLVATLIVEPR